MTQPELAQVGFLTHAMAAAGYLLLAILVVLRSRKPTFSTLMVAAAAVASAVWAALVAYDLRLDVGVEAATQALEIARNCLWMLLLLGLLHWVPPVSRSGWAMALIAVCSGISALLFLLRDVAFSSTTDISLLPIAAYLAMSIVGLGLVENLYRNYPVERRWSIKHLCLGAGALFAYDFYLYADALLFRHLSYDLFVARGVSNLLILPLFALYAMRSATSGPQIAISRRFAFHTATVISAGLYLMTMAAAGFYVRRFGGSWSVFLQAVFFFGAVLLLIVPLSSGKFRAALRIFVEKSFFQYKYDYRAEWLRFIQTISHSEAEQNLRTRVVMAVGEIVESPEGGVWLRREDRDFELAATWNLSRWNLADGDTTIPADGSLVRFLERQQWIVDVGEYIRRPERYEGLDALPDWLKDVPRASLVLPLFHHGDLLGIIILGRPRVARDLSWEDFDLLKTVARQAASYLAEQAMSEALTAAQQFSAFNKRFAFAVHDVKNLVSKLSLLLSNFDRHRDNAEFQKDMIDTIRQSVDKINRMLRQLNAATDQRAGRKVELVPMLKSIAASHEQVGTSISLNLQCDDAAVPADEDRLKAVVEHLVENAIEAGGTDGRVEVRLRRQGDMAVLEIEDNGPGMDAKFVRERLFRPFASTKDHGYGIGAYESREYAQALGGRLEVVSRPGRGTVMRMQIPAESQDEV